VSEREREREAWEVSLTEIGHLMLKCTVDSPVIAAGMAKTPPVLYLLIMWSSTGVTSLSRYRLINFTSCHWKRSHSVWDRGPGLILAPAPAILPQCRLEASLPEHRCALGESGQRRAGTQNSQEWEANHRPATAWLQSGGGGSLEISFAELPHYPPSNSP